MFWRIITLAIFFLALSACTTLPDGPETAVNLPSQLQQLKTVEHWQIKGKMAIRNDKEAVSAHLNWKTDAPDFDFRLTNMLGITLATLSVNDGMASLEADDKHYEGTNPSRLIYQTTGWDIPVNRLLNWIKGLPLAGDDYQLNDKQLLASLSPACDNCGNWKVIYSNYGNVDGIWLPHQLTLTQTNNSKMLIKIRIDEWKLQ